MFNAIKRVLGAIGNLKLASWLQDIAISGFNLGLDTAQKDTRSETPFEPDMESILRIGIRTHALSEKTIARAKGNLAFNADKLYQEMDAAMRRGMSKREALLQIQGRLRNLFTDSLEEWELERLARDQFLVATKEGRRTGWEKGGMKYRQWKIHLDDHTAADSKRMEGQIVGINEPYTDPLTGEKYMLPHIRPNDRCWEVGLWELPVETVERDGLIFAKGGLGSGIKGHRTAKKEKLRKFKKLIQNTDDWQDIAKICKNLQKKNKIVSAFINGWYSSGVLASGLDLAVTKTFGLNLKNSRIQKDYNRPESGFSSDIKEYSKHITEKEKFIIEKIYIANQEILKRLYPKKVIRLFRGVDGNTFEKFKNMEYGDKATVTTFNLTSWSEDKDMAEDFAKENDERKGVVIRTDIPIKNVFLCYQATEKDWEKEKEMIVFGPSIGVTIEKLFEEGKVKRKPFKIKKFIDKSYSNIHIDEETINDNWLRSMRKQGIRKGGEGSGILGHTTYKKMNNFERNIRTAQYEIGGLFDKEGKVLFIADGTNKEITFTPKQKEILFSGKGSVFTHNHPPGGSFSWPDIYTSCRGELNEVRAVGKEYNYSLKIKKKVTRSTLNEMKQENDKLFRKAYYHYIKRVSNGTMTLREALIAASHDTITMFVREFPEYFGYKRTLEIKKGGPGSGILGHRTDRGVPSKAYKIIEDFEEKIRKEPLEHSLFVDMFGKVVLQKKGDETSVSFTKEEKLKISQADNVIFTHNHPKEDISFSINDLKFSIFHGIREARAVSTKHTYVATFEKGINLGDFMKAYVETYKNTFFEVQPKVLKGEITSEDASTLFFNMVWERIDSKFPRFHYRKTEKFAKGGPGSGITGHTTYKEDKAHKHIRLFEERFKAYPFENCFCVDGKGTPILRKEGGQRSISFTNEEMLEIKLADNTIFTHNHPAGFVDTFSVEDIRFAIGTKIKEMRVVTQGRTFTMKFKGKVDVNVLQRAYDIHYGSNFFICSEKINKGEMGALEANMELFDNVWKAVVEDIPNLEYKGTKTKPIQYNKGGPGSGIKGHRTEKNNEGRAKAHKVIHDFEKKYRARKMENGILVDKEGNILVQAKGTKKSIRYTKEQEDFFRSGKAYMFSHNHPNDASFSWADIQTAIISFTKETRAVGENNTFILKIKKQPVKEKKREMKATFTTLQDDYFFHYRGKVMRKEMEVVDANLEYSDRAMKSFVDKYPDYFDYQKIIKKKTEE